MYHVVVLMQKTKFASVATFKYGLSGDLPVVRSGHVYFTEKVLVFWKSGHLGGSTEFLSIASEYAVCVGRHTRADFW